MEENKVRAKRIGTLATWAALLVLVCVGASYFVTGLMVRNGQSWEHDEEPGRHWLHQELDLTPVETASVDAFEPDYRRDWAKLLENFNAQIARLRGLMVEKDDFSPEVNAAIHELDVVHGSLQELSIRHYYDRMSGIAYGEEGEAEEVGCRGSQRAGMSDGTRAMDTDLLAIERVQGGDEQGLVALMERHREPIFRFCFRFVTSETDAADLTEETFVRVLQNASKYRPRAKVVTWIFSIAGNMCRDLLRPGKKRRNDVSLSSQVPGADSLELADMVETTERSPDQEAVASEALSAIEAAVASLPYALKFPFIFCFLEERSYDDCTEVLNTNRKTMEMRIYRARKPLRAACGVFEYFLRDIFMGSELENIAVKHMVCPRCIATVGSIVDRLGLPVESVSLGEVKLKRQLTDAEFRSFAEMLKASGFEVLFSKEKRLVNQIKSLILERVHYADIYSPLKLSAYLAESLSHEYSYLSKLFSAVEAVTIERYSMLQRIERAKELLSYGELNVTEISELLDFSSAAHFSAQFKRETGMSPSQFKGSDRPARRSLDSI